MRLSELRARFIDYHTGDTNRFLDMDNIEDYGSEAVIIRKISLEKYLDMTRLGSGCCAAVYDIGKNLVLKVCQKLDKGYDAYIRACKENRDNPNLPRVYYIGEWAGRTVYILEKLTELDQTMKDFVVSFCRRGVQGMPLELSPMLNPAYFSEGLVSACHMVKEITDSDRNYCIDMHGGNIMLRSNGCIVITDPLTHYERS